jgi:hypothetical protein
LFSTVLKPTGCALPARTGHDEAGVILMEGITRALAILALLALWFVVKIGCIGAAYWFEMTYPATAQRIFDIYRERPRKCFLVGIVNLALGLFIVAVLLGTEVLALLGLLLFAAIVAIAVLAYLPAYRNMAERMDSANAAPPISPSARILQSAVAAEAVFMAPALGQALSAGSLIRGFGAVLLAWLTGMRGRGGS